MRRHSPNSTAGYTLVELLVVIVLMSIIGLLSYPSLQRMIFRSKLQGMSTEVAIMVQRTRFESIKRAVPGAIEFSAAGNELIAYVDLNDAAGTPTSDLVFNPGLSGGPGNPTDILLGRVRLTAGIDLRAPGVQPEVDAFTPSPGPRNVAVFDPDGSARDVGAFRFADPRDNFLEIRIEPAATGRVQLRKWEDFGTGNDWYGPGDTNHPWKWNM